LLLVWLQPQAQLVLWRLQLLLAHLLELGLVLQAQPAASPAVCSGCGSAA
jgi:hypothetical protein